MNILLTNDDGIHAPGIYAVHSELKKIGTLTIVAPDSERSSVGHGITLAHPIWYKKINKKGSFFGHGISGTPADCVKFACAVLMKKAPDVVVSGINLGPNDGCSVHYSGTVAGAREAAMMGIPAVAVSLGTFINPDFTVAAKYVKRILKTIPIKDMPKGSFLNINIPAIKESKIKGVMIIPQGLVPIHGTFQKRKDPNLKDYYWLTGKLPTKTKQLKDDTQALSNNYVTITPIHCDSTDYTYLNQLKDIKIR